MKSQNIVFILLVVAVVFTAVSTAMGWYFLLDQDNKIVSLGQQQQFVANKVTGLNRNLAKLETQIKTSTSDFKILTKEFKIMEQSLNASRLRDKELSARMTSVGDKLQTWELINDEIIDTIVNLNQGVAALTDQALVRQAAVETEPVKEIELGEVSIRKNTSSVSSGRK
jgi:chromosome segregation ATPase